MHNAGLGLRVSNGIAILMLFLTGYAYGKCVDRSPWLTGLSMVVVGGILVGRWQVAVVSGGGERLKWEADFSGAKLQVVWRLRVVKMGSSAKGSS